MISFYCPDLTVLDDCFTLFPLVCLFYLNVLIDLMFAVKVHSYVLIRCWFDLNCWFCVLVLVATCVIGVLLAAV